MPNEEEYLIHFTSYMTGYKKFSDRDDTGFKNLLGIVENGFEFNARKTYVPQSRDQKHGIELRLEMICFAEITLREIFENKEKFGNFGICMKKKWVEKYFGQPVIYAFSSSFNNNILVRLNELIYITYNLYLENKDKRINQISLEIADLSNLLQGLMEPINHKSEKERRIINYPNNEILKNDIEVWHKEKIINNFIVEQQKFFLPISQGKEAEFFIIPKGYQELFCDKVVNSDDNRRKILFVEDILCSS